MLKDQIKPEFMQSQVEVGSRICQDMAEARAEVVRLRSTIMRPRRGFQRLGGGGGERPIPFSMWSEQDITIKERYAKQLAEMADLAKRLLIFGMHVHVGIEDQGPAHRHHGSGALLPAAPAGVVDQLALLARTQHGSQVVSLDHLREPAEKWSAARLQARGVSTSGSSTRW